MSTPINHHYVSQCHQREFFNEAAGYIYVYDKELKNFYRKKTTKTLFSGDHINSKQGSDYVDHTTLETELKLLFEDDFKVRIDQLKAFIIEPKNLQEMYEILGWFTLMGILGQIRHPKFKTQLTELLRNMGTDVLNISTGISKGIISKFLKDQLKTPYDNNLSYIDTALRILERMEPMEYVIYSIECDTHFILPDTSCFQVRGQLKPYPNQLINEIIQVGIPLTDKIFVLASSSALGTNENGIQSILEEDAHMAMNINLDLFHFAYKSIACKDEQYLKQVVEFAYRAENYPSL
jgi:hypothetical protein